MVSAINAKAKSDMFNIITKSKSQIQKVTRLVLLEIGYRLDYRSPVGDPELWNPSIWPKGYIPGHFRNNWQVGIDSKPTGTIDAVDPTGQSTLDRLRRLGRWPVGHTYYFVNNLPYAQELEMGWSSQAPAGMVGITKLEYPSIVREAEAKVKAGA